MGRLFIASLVFFLIDQFTKWYVVIKMDLRNLYAIDVLPPILNFRMAWNDGINFGLNIGGKWVMIALAIAIVIAMIIWSRKFTGWTASILFGMTIGGALGNVLDRVIYGAVVDFLNMSCCGYNNPFSFNVADIFVFAGLIGLAIFSERLPTRA
jgi:signal peptidase II